MSFNIPKNRTLTRISTRSLSDGPKQAGVAIILRMQPHETRIRVRYAETDQMGVVYYANYLVWMEVARVEYCRALGFRYKDMELEDGVLLAVVEAHCRYLYPARFDEELIVRTWVDNANSRMVQFGYEMESSDGKRKVA